MGCIYPVFIGVSGFVPLAGAHAPRYKIGMIIMAENLALHRGLTPVLHGLSFTVGAGQMAALTGANGSGKTTLLQTIAGLIAPDDGTLVFDGANLHPTDRAPLIHWIAPDNPFKHNLSVGENLIFWAAMMGVRANTDMIAAALHKMEVAHLHHRMVGALSTGQRRRATLCRLFLAPRPIWLLDEPTLALDDHAADDLVALTHAHCGDGGLAIVATHRPQRWDANVVIALTPERHLMPEMVA